MNPNHAPINFTRNVTSIHGGRIGLTIENAIVGPTGIVRKVTELNTTTPSTAVPSHGFIRVSGLASTDGPLQHTLDAPIPGVSVTLALACTSTGSIQFGTTANGASIIATSLGTTVGWVNMTGPGGAVTLLGVSTSQFMVTGVDRYTSTALASAINWTTST